MSGVIAPVLGYNNRQQASLNARLVVLCEAIAELQGTVPVRPKVAEEHPAVSTAEMEPANPLVAQLPDTCGSSGPLNGRNNCCPQRSWHNLLQLRKPWRMLGFPVRLTCSGSRGMTQVTSGDRLVNDVSGQRRVTVWYEVSRRTLDVIGSLLLLAFTLPVLLLVAFLVKIDLRGPVLYRQSRVGLHGRIFTMLKFRSMRVDAEAAGPCWAAKRDPRMTRIGAFIRATRLDEVPQLLNVLRGEMSLVGPRPERPHFVQQLAAIIPRYNERTHVLPGITGWAQINYSYGASVEDARAKLAFDLFYINNRSLLLDLHILLKTIPVVLFRIGAR